MKYEIEIIDTETQHALSIRTRSSVENLSHVINSSYRKILDYMESIKQNPADPPFVAYYDSDADDLDIEIGFPVLKELSGKGEIASSIIPSGLKVTCMYKGSYRNIGEAYEEIARWMEENNHEPKGVSYEFYYNSPNEVDESDLITRILFPIKY